MDEKNKKSMISFGIPSKEPDPIYITKRNLIILGLIVVALFIGAFFL